MTGEQHQVITYEYPLQERYRTYLRLEHSFSRLRSALAQIAGDDQELASSRCRNSRYETFLKALFDCQELIERCDIRNELGKDLEQQQQLMKQWEHHPQIDQTALQGALRSVANAVTNLQHFNNELRQLKDDKLLASVRTRFVQPGVSGLFELPQLQLWLSQPDELTVPQVQYWYSLVEALATAVDLQLELTRQQTPFTDTAVKNGFWQESCEPLSLLRIRIPTSIAGYPIVSGHRQRFTIRFLELPKADGQSDAIADDFSIQLARCPLI